jgi:hypothetical protein
VKPGTLQLQAPHAARSSTVIDAAEIFNTFIVFISA